VAGLIRWKIVFHCFVDGCARFVTGVQANNNNRAQTVLELFESAITVHGVPSRVHGDHGTENVLVRQLMELLRGSERGSYILGRYGRQFHMLVSNTFAEVCITYALSAFGVISR
jgi:hypothetical protein